MVVGTDAAVSSLLGVVAGGVITYTTQRGLDGRRERREREREARAEQRQGLSGCAYGRCMAVDQSDPEARLKCGHQ